MVRVRNLSLNNSFSNGTKYEYNGGRTSDAIVSWVSRRTGPPSRKLSCEAVASRLYNKINVVYFGDFEGELFESYIEVASSNFIFNHYHSAGACAKEMAAKAGTINIFRQFDEQHLVYEGKPDAKDILSWIADASLPKLISFSDDYADLIFGKEIA